MRLIQYRSETGALAVAEVVDARQVRPIRIDGGTLALARAALADGRTLAEQAARCGYADPLDYAALVHERRIAAPLTHDDPAHCVVTGTGLTHLGSADTRHHMHGGPEADDPAPTSDSMRMFRMGLRGGKPDNGSVGVQPEWFYKGDGTIVAAPGEALTSPAFAEDAGEEPELVGVYVIDADGVPRRLGFALGNELSDHRVERHNYLWLAHSKLRSCSIGPELRTGALPAHLEGVSRIRRDGAVLWEKPFVTGEANMSHSIANLEHHHFKYRQFRRPGDVHLHFMGTATLSFADDIRTRDGDEFEIGIAAFGRPLRNPLRLLPAEAPTPVRAL